MSNRNPSFIECFETYCQNFPTPDLFKKWAGISAVAGALERRVWGITRNIQLIPNFIILLVSPPGIGKTVVISEVHDLWLKVKPELNISPTSITRAGFIDQLNAVHLSRLIKDSNGIPTGNAFFYHSLNVAAPEFGVLIPKHDLEFLNTINDLYDCRSNYVERKRSIKDVINIPRPHTNILAGTQPSYLGDLLPDTAYGMGFTSRCIMVYQGIGPRVEIFGDSQGTNDNLRKDLIFKLSQIAQLYGQVSWDSEAALAIQSWVDGGMLPSPEHFRLTNYNTRRDLHLLKLCIISSASHLRMKVILEDFLWARDTLIEAESFMPDVFKDMMAGPDTQIKADLSTFVRGIYAKDRKPVSFSRIIHFLSSRIPSNRVVDILQTTVTAGYLKEYASSTGTKSYEPGNVG